RVDAERDPHAVARVLARQRYQRRPRRRADRRHQDPVDAGRTCPGQDIFPVTVEGGDVEVAVAVDHRPKLGTSAIWAADHGRRDPMSQQRRTKYVTPTRAAIDRLDHLLAT